MKRENVIRQALGRNNLTQKELANEVIISEPTLSKKIKNPTLFTLGEVEKLDRELHFTDQEKNILIKGEWIWII